MPTTSITIERELSCACLALAPTPFPACPECGGGGFVWREIDVEIEYIAHRAYRGARDSFGAQLEPDEPARCEIERASVELTGRETERAEEACEQDTEESALAAEEARDEARMERLRERW